MISRVRLTLSEKEIKERQTRILPTQEGHYSNLSSKDLEVMERLIFDGPLTVFDTERKINIPHSTTFGIFKNLLKSELIEIVEESKFRRTGLMKKKYGPTLKGLFQFIKERIDHIDRSNIETISNKYKGSHWIFNEYSNLKEKKAEDLGDAIFKTLFRSYDPYISLIGIEKTVLFSFMDTILCIVLYPERFYARNTRKESFDEAKKFVGLEYEGDYDLLRSQAMEYLRQNPELLSYMIRHLDEEIASKERQKARDEEYRIKFIEEFNISSEAR